MNSRADIKDRRQKKFPEEHKTLFFGGPAKYMLPFNSIRNTFFPLVRKDSVFGSSRGDDL